MASIMTHDRQAGDFCALTGGGSHEAECEVMMPSTSVSANESQNSPPSDRNVPQRIHRTRMDVYPTT